MVWFLAPVIVVAARFAVQAWQEHEAAEQRRREREATEQGEREREQQREYEQAQKREQAQARANARKERRAAAELTMRHDYRAHLVQWLHDHGSTLHGSVPQPVGNDFSFAELVNLAQAEAPTNLAGLIALARPLLPNLALAGKQQQQMARISQLQNEISQLQQLASQIGAGGCP